MTEVNVSALVGMSKTAEKIFGTVEEMSEKVEEMSETVEESSVKLNIF